MNQEIKFNELFGKPVLTRIILFFLENSTKKFSQVELIKKIKLSKTSAVKWLNRLNQSGLIKTETKGTNKIYEINRENIIVKHLKKLNTLIKLNNLKDIENKFNASVYLYGSAARGEDVEESDIDILIIGRVKKEYIIQETNKLSEKIKKNIKIEVLSEIEWSQMARKDPAFYERVEKDKIKL